MNLHMQSVKAYIQLPQETHFFFSEQSFHLWSFIPDFQGKQTKHLSKINLEKNFKTQLEDKTNRLKWVSHFTELYNLSSFPPNLCTAAGYDLPHSFFTLRAKYLFLLFSILLIPVYFIGSNYIYMYIFFFTKFMQLIGILLKLEKLSSTHFFYFRSKKVPLCLKECNFFPNTAREASKLFWFY